MAKKETRICDIDNARGIETIGPNEHLLSLDGYEVALDLSDGASAELLRVLRPYLDAGKWLRKDHAIVRTWARINGYPAPKTSRIPDATYEAYDAAEPESRELAAAEYKAEQAAKKTSEQAEAPVTVAAGDISHRIDA